MENLLNHGLNFAITPLKLNMTQVLVDFKRFERTMLWQEFWAGKPTAEYKPPIFKKQKTNLPTKHPTPQALKVFLNATNSELSDPQNRNKIRPNLPPDEVEALGELIRLQKERVITIKPCDKGAGIIILDFEDYMKSCENHLNSQQKQADGTSKPYYCKVYDDTLEDTKKKILDVLRDGLEKEYITKDEFDAMDPSDKGPGKFYELFKVHKDHPLGATPPERPIISASGSITENIAQFVEHNIKHLANKHQSYLQDTPDFLRNLELVKAEGNLPDNSILVSIDVSALYTNIPQEEGLEEVREALKEREKPEIPTDFLLKLVEIILGSNIFEFNSKLFMQLIGTAMGTKPAPSYANIFMARKIDQRLRCKVWQGDLSNPILQTLP